MIRKRTIIIVITILLLLAGILFYLQWGRQMDVSSSSGSGSDNHYELRVSVILNTLVVTDQQKCAEQIFEKCRDNSFHSVRFSYDIQIPHALSVTVYKNQKDAESGNSAFSFSYRQENQIDGTYNIVDNPEKFTLEMEFYTPLVPKSYDFLGTIGELAHIRQDGQVACEAKATGTD